MAHAGRIIRLFVSSTFSDFGIERELLHREVFPAIRDLCQREGFRFQPIDLRWGVPEEASKSHHSIAICLEEVRRCQRESPDLNLLILLGDRYGTISLPEIIPADTFTRLSMHLEAEARALLHQWYREDVNALPPEYVLLPRTSDYVSWKREIENPLRAALAHACASAGLSADDMLPFVGSITHQEIYHGLLADTCDSSAAICAMRSFNQLPTGPCADDFVEQNPAAQERLTRLKRDVADRLGNTISAYSADWQEDGPAIDRTTVRDQLRELLERRIAETIKRRKEVRQGDSITKTNTRFAEEQTAHFTGRQQALAAITAYLASSSQHPLVVGGPSGSGKSTLLAQAAKEATHVLPGASVILRQIGLLPGTATLRDLLLGLYDEIALNYEDASLDSNADENQLIQQLPTYLARATAEHPLVVIIDALDQLEMTPRPADWLPTTLPPHVHLIASAIADRLEYTSLCQRLPIEQIIALEPMTLDEGRQLLERWLADRCRCLQPFQESMILQAFAVEGRPLFLRLAFEEARLWHSFVEATRLPHTIAEIISRFFIKLSMPDHHGPALVAHSLGYLAAARNGLAEDELLDVLAADDTVRADLQRIAPASPPIDPTLPLPPVLWARLYAEIQPYLTQREADGAQLITFYHRQLHEVAEALYLHEDEGSALHCQLAHYFSAQPVVFDGGEHAEPNLRQITELPYQQALGKLYRELEQTLTSIEFLEWKIASQGTVAVLQDYDLLPNVPFIGRVARAIRLGAHILDVQPAELANQLRGRLGSLEGFHRFTANEGPEFRLDSTTLATPDGPLVRVFAGPTDCLHSCALSPEGRILAAPARDGIVWLWEVSTGRVLHTLDVSDVINFGTMRCQFSGDGQFLLCAIPYRSIQLWEVAAGRLARTIGSDLGELTDCAYSSDGRYALTAAEHPGWRNAQTQPRFKKELLNDPIQATQLLNLWDMDSGAMVRSFEGSEFSVRCCAFSPDGQLALAATRDHSLRLWNVASGKTVHVLQGHTSDIDCCAFSSDGRYILSGGGDATLRLWDASTGTLIRTLSDPGHDGSFICCAISHNGRLALSGTLSHRGLQLWDLVTGELISTYPGQEERVSGCAFTLTQIWL